MSTHEEYMLRCLQLAKHGLFTVRQNPMVGCVIVLNETIVAEGYHKAIGKNHAEIDAISKITDTTILKKCTLYVNLEPCFHHGKTPPCVLKILKCGIPKVIIGTRDPNPKVGGKSIQLLKNNGVDVIENILTEECIALNTIFFTFFQKKRPYIFLKWAETKDGFIDKEKKQGECVQHRISSQFSAIQVHRYRAMFQSILVGAKTVIQDNPKLNVRHVTGQSPVRIVIDKHNRLWEAFQQKQYHVFDNTIPTKIYTTKHEYTQENITFQPIETEVFLKGVLDDMYFQNISSVFVEGGQKTLECFIESSIWDEAIRYKNMILSFYKGIKSPNISEQYMLSCTQEDNREYIYHYKNG